jgi:glutamate N-acetyltransferase/amino-acid N-acetyltransferase
MLVVITTDADLGADELDKALRSATAVTFDRLDADGCTSTNDTVLVLAGGAAGPVDERALGFALSGACASLGRQLAGDAEGATKVIVVEVTGASSDDEARVAARKIAESELVKCSFYGEDPYWGRVVSEAGSAGVAFDPDKVAVSYGHTRVCEGGVPLDHDRDAVTAHLAQREVAVSVDLGLGRGRGTILTNDLTHAYIDENMRTS